MNCCRRRDVSSERKKERSRKEDASFDDTPDSSQHRGERVWLFVCERSEASSHGLRDGVASLALPVEGATRAPVIELLQKEGCVVSSDAL